MSRVTMLANEHLIETHSSSAAGAWVRGNDFINKLLLYRSPHIDRLKHLLSTSTGFATADYNMALSHWQLYCEQMEQAIQLDNEAIAQNNTAYWENLTDQVKLRDGFIRDQEYLMAYALYQFNYQETPIYATGQALIQQEITEEQLYSQLNAWTLADQLVYPIVDFVGLIPGVDIGADLVGFFYAQLRGDMQQAPLYAMALMLPPGLDNMAQYGGRGSCKMVAVYTANGITYVPKLADEPIDEAVEAVRASVLTHDPVIAQAIIDADAPYIFHEADELYKNRHSAIYQGAGNDLAKAKLITGEIADHCPLLLANHQLVSRELSEVLAGIPNATKRKAFLETLEGFGDIGKLTTFVEDLANAPGLVVALKGRWELVRAWDITWRAGLEPSIRLNVVDLNRIASYQAATSKSADDIVAEIEGSAITAAGSTRSWLDNIPSGGGVQIGTHGDYLIHETAELFYRGMSESDYQHLLNTGELRGTSETFTSHNLEYIIAKNYGNDGRVVKFYARSGTLDDLFEIGVRDSANRTLNYYPTLPHVSTVDSWTQNKVLFKTEGGQLVEEGLLDDTQVNIGLGVGEGLRRFNSGIQAFEVVHVY